MSTPLTFTPDEWELLLLTPLYVIEVAIREIWRSHSRRLTYEKAYLTTELENVTNNGNQLLIRIYFDLLDNLDDLRSKKKNRLPVDALKEASTLLASKVTSADHTALMESFKRMVHGSTDPLNRFSERIFDSSQWVFVQIGLTHHTVSGAAVVIVPRASTPQQSLSESPAAKGSKTLPVFLLIDSSRHLSDSALLFEQGLRHFTTRLQGRKVVNITLSLSVTLTERHAFATLAPVAQFHSPTLNGTGMALTGEAMTQIAIEVQRIVGQSKPLVASFIAGMPDDSWTVAADQLVSLASQNKANVFTFGIGGFQDRAVLRRLTATTPLVLTAPTTASVTALFDWLYAIIDTILSGMESGGTGQRSVPLPPSDLQVLA